VSNVKKEIGRLTLHSLAVAIIKKNQQMKKGPYRKLFQEGRLAVEQWTTQTPPTLTSDDVENNELY
jgi:hypothetical protein